MRTHFPSQPRRRLLILSAVIGALSIVGTAGPALACAGLVTPGGNVKLLRTATLAGWADGYEHYVTSFTFQGGGAEVGSIVPLPAVPEKVERGGDWTLQRLAKETQPRRLANDGFGAERSATAAPAERAEVVYETRIDALDITILKGGAQAVGDWAREHGFSLTPDAPATLEYYARQSPVFMAARFNTEAADERGQPEGEGTPIHLTIPLDRPWVPLHILALGRQESEFIDADVYLLTPRRPDLHPAPVAENSGRNGLVLAHDAQATKPLLDDLRSDKGMEWIPEDMWLTLLRVNESAQNLDYDLAIDTSRTAPATRVVTDAKTARSQAPSRQQAQPVALPAFTPARNDQSPARPALVAAGAGAALGAAVAAVMLNSMTRRRLASSRSAR